MSTLKPVKIEVKDKTRELIDPEAEAVAMLVTSSFNIACIKVELAAKEAEVVAKLIDDNSPGVWIKSYHENIVEIRFPEYLGWELFSADIMKYRLSVCLTKKKKEKVKKVEVDPRLALTWPFPVQKPVIQ